MEPTADARLRSASGGLSGTGVTRAVAAHAVLALAATGVVGVSLGLWTGGSAGPQARAGVVAGTTGPAGSLVPLAAAEAPAGSPAAAASAEPVPPRLLAAPAAPMARAEPLPEAALTTVTPTEHRITDGRGGRGVVRWAGAAAATSGVRPAAAPAAPVAPPVEEAELTTRPIPAAARASLQTGSFFGLPAGRRTVYLVDASGSLVDSLASALEELSRSLMTLDPSQSYAVLFFQDGRVFAAPPGRMAPADRGTTARTAAFVDPEAGRLAATGRADAAAALREALALDPDAVVLLTDRVDGRRDPAGTRSRLLRLAEEASATTAIHTIQFVDAGQPPAGGGLPTLEAISALTGGTHRFVGF